MSAEKILIIKLGALGDFIQTLGAMKAIKAHHQNAEITLLTTKPFKEFAHKCGYIDTVWIDEKPTWLMLPKWLELKKQLNTAHFTRIYDLQNNDRTSIYFRLLKRPKPEWVGTVKGASHRNASPERTQAHAFEGHKQTLALAGITNIEIDKLHWMDGDLSAFDLNPRYALIVAGCAPKHPHKRWPAEHYTTLANHLAQQGIQPVLLGTLNDAAATDAIAKNCPKAINLTAKTTLEQITALARGAQIAIGNDTGPMHLIAATGCPCLSLFSGKTNPIKHAPLGNHVTTLQENELRDLSTQRVINAAKQILS